RHADVVPPGNTAGPVPDGPEELDRLHPAVWPRNCARGQDGVVRVAGLDVRDLAEEFGTPLFVLDEADFRSRCREYAEAFGDPAAVHYAAKAFLSVKLAQWVAEEGLSLDVCSGGELSVALRAGFPPERIAFHGNNKSLAELTAAVRAGVGLIVVDSFYEIARLEDVAQEGRKLGCSLASGAAAEAVRRVVKAPSLVLAGLHSHIGSQIFQVDGFELAAHRVVQLLAQLRQEHGAEALAEASIVDLGGGLGIAYTAQDDPLPPAELARRLREIVQREAEEAGIPQPRISVEPGRAIVGPGMVTLYEVGTIKDVSLDGGAQRRYISVDGGMSDNIRTPLYDAV